MVKDDDDLEESGSNRPNSSDSDDTDMVGVLDDDVDTRGTDQSEHILDDTLVSDDGEDEDDDDTESDALSTDESLKRFTIPAQQRNVTLVLSKTRAPPVHQQTHNTSSDMNKNSTPDVNHNATNTPIKANTHATTSPIRIKLSFKKLPVNDSKQSDEVKLREPYQYDVLNVPLDQSISRNQNLDKSLKTDDGDQAAPTTKAIESAPCDDTELNTLISTPKKAVSNGNSLTVEKSVKTNTAKVQVQESLPIVSKVATGTASKRRSLQPTKQVRMPPLTSPGLRMLRPPIHVPPPQNTASDSSTTSRTYYTPQQIFDVVMTGAGYTHEQRTNHPHRGSSVERTIDDMFDTNVHLALHRTELIPEIFWNHVPRNNKASSSVLNDDVETLPHRLIAALENSKDRKNPNQTGKADVENCGTNVATRKRPRPSFEPLQLRDMVPVSLTIPYPEWYLQKRAEYVKLVKQREMAIIAWQAAQEEIEMSGEDYFASDADNLSAKSNRSPFLNPATIPPIPQPPDPPKLHELLNLGTDVSEDNDAVFKKSNLHFIAPYMEDGALDRDNTSRENSAHPYYLPKTKEKLVGHLDPNCFHIADGRYFGLETNLIADPNFIGPNVPGLSGSTNTGGLATATTSTTTSTSGLTGGGMTMILSASYHSAAAVAPANIKDENANTCIVKVQPIQSEEAAVNVKSLTDSLVDHPASLALLPTETVVKVGNNELTSNISTTRTLSDLRAIMEGDDVKLIESFRECIVQSIVHTYRFHKSASVPFLGPNNETYPDIGKAFAWFGGIKPCDRCKNNKQGVCRHLR